MGIVEVGKLAHASIESIGELRSNSTIESIEYSEEDLKAIMASKKQRRVAEWVEKLIKAYGHKESLAFYRKAAWHLSDNELAVAMEMAKRPWVIDRHRYFIWAANERMHARGD